MKKESEKQYRERMLRKQSFIENDGHKHKPVTIMGKKYCNKCGKEM